MQPFSPLLRGDDMSVILIAPASSSADHRATLTGLAAPEGVLGEALTTFVAGPRGATRPARAQARP